MRKLVLILIASIAAVTLIRALDIASNTTTPNSLTTPLNNEE
jgi:hypothetical protein